MTDTKHTPEPWAQFAFGEVKDGTSDKDCERHIAKFRRAQDAARAIDCVNALAGIDNPSEWVENMKKLNAKQSKLNLDKLSTKLDAALESETEESLNQFLDNLPFKRGEGNYFHCTDYETAVEVVKDLQQQIEQLTKENKQSLKLIAEQAVKITKAYEEIEHLKQLTKQP